MDKGTQAAPVRYRDVLGRSDFFRVWSAQAVSYIGDRLTQVALFIYILQLAGGSAAAVGYFMACQALPIILLGPVAGVLADRWDKRKTMVACDIARAAIILTVPFLGDARLVYLIGFLMASVSTLFTPAMQASVPELLGRREEIMVANSLLYSTKFFTDILGFTLAGAVVAVTGVKIAFIIDAFTFLISALFLVRLTTNLVVTRERLRSLAGVWKDLIEGIRYHQANPVVLSLLISFSLGVLAMGGLNALLLIAVDRLLSVDRFWYGYLLGVQGVTMFSTTMALGKWATRVPKPYLILPGFLGTGLCAVALSVTRSLPLAFGIYGVLGVANAVFLVPSLSWVQEVVPFEFRGRVMALRSMALNLVALVSYVAAGSLADRLGVTPVMAGVGWFLVFTAVVSLGLPGFKVTRRPAAGAGPPVSGE